MKHIKTLFKNLKLRPFYNPTFLYFIFFAIVSRIKPFKRFINFNFSLLDFEIFMNLSYTLGNEKNTIIW